MNTESENSMSPDHPHGKPDPRWITDDGRCLLCADSYHKQRIAELEANNKYWVNQHADEVARREKVEVEINEVVAVLREVSHRVHSHYDWNSDPDQMTLKCGKIFERMTEIEGKPVTVAEPANNRI